MKIISIILLWLTFIISNLSANLGVTIHYTVKGNSIGKTTLRGKCRVLFQPAMKRLTGSIYYQEAGNPFPDLEEKDIIVDYTKKKKEYYTKDSRSWLTIPFAHEKASRVKVKVRKVKKDIKITVTASLKKSQGGKQKYIITFSYEGKKNEKTNLELKKYKIPSPADILSLFINNEKIIAKIAKKSIIKNYGIPDKFKIEWYQKKKKKLHIEGKLKMKTVNIFPEDTFSMDNIF